MCVEERDPARKGDPRRSGAVEIPIEFPGWTSHALRLLPSPCTRQSRQLTWGADRGRERTCGEEVSSAKF